MITLQFSAKVFYAVISAFEKCLLDLAAWALVACPF